MNVRTTIKSGLLIMNHAESCGLVVRSTVKSGAAWNHAESCGLKVRSTVKSGAAWNHAESCTATSAR